ncbi:MAG: hypothetical protein GXO99_03305 [Nitrospirae bacterium]|nr:hypothetical protein [Nitrospirota bacterium]
MSHFWGALQSGWNDPLVPDEKPGGYSFVKPCSNHDKCYRSCGRSKVECDNIFFNDMKEVCQNLNGLWYYDCISTAQLYYYAVTIFGGPAYNKAQKHCRCEESW